MIKIYPKMVSMDTKEKTTALTTQKSNRSLIIFFYTLMVLLFPKKANQFNKLFKKTENE